MLPPSSKHTIHIMSDQPQMQTFINPDFTPWDNHGIYGLEE